MSDNIIYCKIVFRTEAETVIKATRVPTLREADTFCHEMAKRCGYAVSVTQITAEQDRQFHEYPDGEDNRKIFTGAFTRCIQAYIYKHDGEDFSNGGISSRFNTVLVPVKGGHLDVSLDNPPPNFVRIVRRNLFGREYVHLEPHDLKDRCCMAGGTFVDTSDSRFSDTIKNGGYPVSLHDRTEG